MLRVTPVVVCGLLLTSLVRFLDNFDALVGLYEKKFFESPEQSNRGQDIKSKLKDIRQGESFHSL